jgi:hypothetical protein
MKTKTSILTLGAALLLVAAVPGKAATISFTSTLGGGDITTSSIGSNAPITGFLEYFNTLTVTGAPSNNGTYTPLFLTESFNTTTDVLTLTGTISGCSTCGSLPGLTVSSTLATIQFSTGLTANASTTSGSVNMPSLASITSITLSATLLADLGLTGSTFTLADLGNVSTSCCSDGKNYQNQTSGILSFSTTSVPEPNFLPLTALLLAAGVLVLRKKKSSSAA